MTLQFPLVAYFSILLTVGLLCTGYALLRRCRQSGDYLTFRFVGIIIGVSLWWLVMSTVKFTATSLELKILFYRLSMAAWIGLPVSTCIFSFIGIYHRDASSTQLHRGVIAFLAGLLAFIMLIPQSALFTTPHLLSVGEFVTLEHGVSVTTAVITGIAWTITLFGIAIALSRVVHKKYVPPVVALAAVIPSLPGIIGVLKLFEIYPAGGAGFNLAPHLAGLATILFAAVTHRKGLTTIILDSRHAAIENATEGYVLADETEIIRDMNMEAKRLVDATVGDQLPSWLAESSAETAEGVNLTTPTGKEIDLQQHTVGSHRATNKVFLLRDRTEQLTRMRKLESRDRLIAELPVGVFRIQRGTSPRFVYMNQAFAELFNISDVDQIDKHAVSDVFGAQQPQLIGNQSNYSTPENPETTEQLFSPPGTDSFWGLVSTYPSSTQDPDMIEGVIVDITAEKQAEALLTEELDNISHDLELTEQLWELSVRLEGFDAFAQEALSLLTDIDTIECAEVVRSGRVCCGEPETIVANGTTHIPDTAVSNAIEHAYTEENKRTETLSIDDERYTLITTPIMTEHVADSALMILSASPPDDRVEHLVTDTAEALAYKRAVNYREKYTDEDKMTELRIANTDTDKPHPLSQLLTTADVDVDIESSPLTFTNVRAEGQITWYLLRADQAVCNAVTAAATAHDSIKATTPISINDDENRSRCQIGIETGDIHRSLNTEGVTVVTVSANARGTELLLHLPTDLKVADIIDIFRTRFPAMHLRSRQTIERESVDTQVFTELDEYQRQAMEAATRMGFFSRPQGATAGDVANTLDIGRTTFTRRLKNAQTTVFNKLLDSQTDTEPADD